MSVQVMRKGQSFAVTFINSMPDSSEILAGETNDARLLKDGSLSFEFQDGWENLGRARVYPTGKVVLMMIKEAAMNQIGRNYGTFTVSRAQCQAKEFRS
jgi:hypothetical protein